MQTTSLPSLPSSLPNFSPHHSGSLTYNGLAAPADSRGTVLWPSSQNSLNLFNVHGLNTCKVQKILNAAYGWG